MESRVQTVLEPLRISCTWPVYRATAPDGRAVFVKVAPRDRIERTKAFLAVADDCPTLPKLVPLDIPELAGRDYICLEWMDAERVNAEDMTDAQADGLLAGYLELSSVMVRATGGMIMPPPPEETCERLYDDVAGYARRHPLVGRLIAPLVEIPEPERTYCGRATVTIHGDLQPKNYGFRGDRLAAVFDIDGLTKGLACEDLAYAFTERCRRAELSAAKRRRLADLFLRVVRASPWPKGDWLFAVNRDRLRIAARRVASHPRSPLTAFDIARRDRPLRRLAELLRD